MKAHFLHASLIVLAVSGSTGLASGQQAQEPPAPARPWDGETAIRVYARGGVGVSGDVRARSDTTQIGAGVAPSWNAALGVEIPLAHAFSVGFEARASSWSASVPGTMSIDQSMLLEISAVPRFRNPWSLSTGEHFSVGVALPIGPTLSFLHENNQTDVLAMIGAHDGMGMGMHVGALAEIQAFVLPRFGITFDVGYLHHFLWHPSAIAGQRDVQIDFGQMVMRIGVIVAL